MGKLVVPILETFLIDLKSMRQSKRMYATEVLPKKESSPWRGRVSSCGYGHGGARMKASTPPVNGIFDEHGHRSVTVPCSDTDFVIIPNGTLQKRLLVMISSLPLQQSVYILSRGHIA